MRTHGARWFYILGPEPGQPGNHAPRWKARMQFYGGEDPATGSAAGCAISYLVGQQLAPQGVTIHLRQGEEIARPSAIFLSARHLNSRVTDVRVGGSTVLVARGKLFLP